MIHESDKTIKWVYVEDKAGNLLAKEQVAIGKAFKLLKDKGYLVATKSQTEHHVTFRIY